MTSAVQGSRALRQRRHVRRRVGPVADERECAFESRVVRRRVPVQPGVCPGQVDGGARRRLGVAGRLQLVHGLGEELEA